MQTLSHKVAWCIQNLRPVMMFGGGLIILVVNVTLPHWIHRGGSAVETKCGTEHDPRSVAQERQVCNSRDVLCVRSYKVILSPTLISQRGCMIVMQQVISLIVFLVFHDYPAVKVLRCNMIEPKWRLIFSSFWFSLEHLTLWKNHVSTWQLEVLESNQNWQKNSLTGLWVAVLTQYHEGEITCSGCTWNLTDLSNLTH